MIHFDENFCWKFGEVLDNQLTVDRLVFDPADLIEIKVQVNMQDQSIEKLLMAVMLHASFYYSMGWKTAKVQIVPEEQNADVVIVYIWFGLNEDQMNEKMKERESIGFPIYDVDPLE